MLENNNIMSEITKLEIGSIVYFHGFGLATIVCSINENGNSWIGLDADGYRSYPLDEVSSHWTLIYKNSDK